MPFSQRTKERVRKQAWFACCICKKISMSLETHHIVPQKDGGPDTEDNAAPLCASCHGSYGGNPDLRSQIRTRRDHWYEQCRNLFGVDSTPGDVFHWIHKHFSLEELERLTIHSPAYLTETDSSGGLDATRFSFSEDEHVHPLIVKELLGWISDRGAPVVGIDLEMANRSNQFHGEFEVTSSGNKPNVKWRDDDAAFRVPARCNHTLRSGDCGMP